MYELLWLVPALPFAGFLVIAAGGRRLPAAAAGWTGCAAVGIPAALSLVFAAGFLFAPPEGHAHTQVLWTWIGTETLRAEAALRLDALSLTMTAVITVVGFLIHIYSTEYMRGDADFRRFFAYLNLFVAAMLVLVLADNLVLLLLGWEGVGLCSFLLIGFWYGKRENAMAARKAFLVTRTGDVALLLAIFLLVRETGTANIADILARAPEVFAEGSATANAAALLLLGGAIGKSAQLPLQVWLPDAMAGPTPVSALIHAATMVTAGVYLIARTHGVFLLAPDVMFVVALVGAATLLLGALAALAQSDIKRVLAYSTVSQLGYMFLALGAGAWSAAMFHFMTHAFFKALLFLGAGAVITALHHEQNLHRMGGLRKKLPLVFWTFLIGTACLAAVPLVTSGFYSKEKILWDVWISPYGGPGFWIAGATGAFLTALYCTRMVALVFFGEAKTEVSERPGGRVSFVLVVLAVWSLIGGGVELPHTFAHVKVFSGFLAHTVTTVVELPPGLDWLLWLLLGIASVLVFGGIAVGWALYRGGEPPPILRRAGVDAARRGAHGGFGFDTAYDLLFVRPFTALARANRADIVDRAAAGTAYSARLLHNILSATQSGRLRWYSATIAAGVILILAIALLT